MSFAYDDATGSVLVNNKAYPVADIVDYDIGMISDKSKFLKFSMRDNTRVAINTGPPTLFKGLGETGKLIDMFEKKYPDLLMKSNKFLRSQIQAGKLPRIASPPGIFLETDEYTISVAFKAVYSQQQVETSYYQSSSTAEGWTTGSLTPETSIRLIDLDTGTLVITNKRLIYSGPHHSFTFPIHEILSLDRYRDGISLNTSIDTQKRMFRRIDGNLYADIIQVLVSKKTLT